jgi:hypothetical protein
MQQQAVVAATLPTRHCLFERFKPCRHDKPKHCPNTTYMASLNPTQLEKPKPCPPEKPMKSPSGIRCHMPAAAAAAAMRQQRPKQLRQCVCCHVTKSRTAL